MEQHPDGLGQWAGVRSDPPPHMRSPAVLDPQNRDPHSAVDKPAPLVDISPQDISMAFDRSQSAISRLCTAIDRGDIKLLQPLRAALVDLLALSTIFKKYWKAEDEWTMLDAGLRAVTAMTDSLMTGNNDTAYDIVLDYIRAISKIIERLWESLKGGARPDPSGQFISTIDDSGSIKLLLELLGSFLDILKVKNDDLAVEPRLSIISKRLEKGEYGLRVSSQNNNTTYNFGGDVVNNNWSRVYVFCDGMDRKTPDLAKKQKKVMKAIKNAIGDRFVPDALHDTQPKHIGCMEGTRLTVLSKFMEWARNDPMRIFWLAGLAGTGKTSIAVTLCRQLQNDAHVLLGGAFFCSRTASKVERTDARRILPTLATALAEQCPEFAAGLEKALEHDASPRAAYSDADVQMKFLLERPLVSLSSSIRPIVFIIDALDECTDEFEVEQVLLAIAALSTSSGATVKFKFILTSRPETHIASNPITKSDRGSILRLETINRTTVTDDIHWYISDAFSKQVQSTTWYKPEDITALAVRSDGLFIFASTMTKYILDGRGPGERMRRLQTAISTGHSSPVASRPLDDMYNLVLTRASDGNKVEDSELEETLRALACILNARAPLSIAGLADLLGRGVEDLRGSLERLYAVLYMPDSIDHPGLRTVHASFGDYLFERADPKVLIPSSLGDKLLAEGCLLVMRNRLCFNVSQSRSSYEFNQNTRPGSITHSLEYACLQWIYHVALTSVPSGLDVEIDAVFRSRFLFWLEVMSILGHIQHAVEILDHASKTVGLAELSKFLRDAHVFLISFREPIERSAPHIYVSALPFEPKDSLVYQAFSPRCTGIITVEVLDISHSRNVYHDEHAVQPLSMHDGPVNSVAVLSDGTAIVSGSDDHTVRIWDARTGKQTYSTLSGHTDSVKSVATARDGFLIASGSEDHSVRLWSMRTQAAVGEPLLGHKKGITSVIFSPDSNWVVSGSHDATVRIWDVARRRPSNVDPLHCHSSVTAVAFTPDGQTIASGDVFGHIQLWDAKNGNLLRTWQVETAERNLGPFRRHDQGILSLEFSPTGTHILSRGRLQCIDEIEDAGDLRAQEFVDGVWDITTGQQTCILKSNGRVGFQHVLTCCPNWRLIASGSSHSDSSDRCNVYLWDVTTGQLVASASTQGDSVRSVAFTPDGRSVVIGCGTRIWVWDAWAARVQFADDSGDAVAALTNNPFVNGSKRTNWITGPSGNLLLWVPPKYQPHLQGGALKLILGPTRVVIGRDSNNLHYGESWISCWK